MVKISISNSKTLIDGKKVTKIARKGGITIYSDSYQNDCSQNFAFMNVERLKDE